LPQVDLRQRGEIEKLFWGIVDIERAASYMYYRKGSPYNRLIHYLKYKERKGVGVRMAQAAANELLPTGFFDGIELIVPLPLSKKKLRKRGYNQCNYIAQGIANVTGIVIEKSAVERTRANESQTHKNRDERWKNVQGIFAVRNIDVLRGKHILLVDDVLTTGATLASCASAIVATGCKVSIFTLAYSNNTM
ncbi:MAG: ComF family protein, partial [Bacteroidaceae bacterium]|nr:ComF family protein [Bacteroidaceae bacterium]